MTHSPLEHLAAAIHHHYLGASERSQDTANAWAIDPAVQRAYEQLDDDAKAANRATANRITQHLATLGYVLTTSDADRDCADDRWQAQLTQAIETQIDPLAQDEHVGWCDNRRANGWTFAPTRDNAKKHHPSLIAWEDLSEAEKDKDRSVLRAIPRFLEIAGCRAVQADANSSSS